MDVLNFRYTYTTKFILPLLFKEDIKYTKIFDETFINAYIADMANKENDDRIHLLFADYPSLNLTKLLPEPITEYQYGEGYVFVYGLEPEFAKDYEKILTGNYSKLSTEAKNRIINFWDVGKDTLLWGTLYKEGERMRTFYKNLLNEDLNDFSPSAEWWTAPRIDREIMGLIKS